MSLVEDMLGAVEHKFLLGVLIGAAIAIAMIGAGALIAESLQALGWDIVFVIGLGTGHAIHKVSDFLGPKLGRWADESR